MMPSLLSIPHPSWITEGLTVIGQPQITSCTDSIHTHSAYSHTDFMQYI